MSGITPILDTLLHQVLGKRVDVPVLRDLPAPVRPLQPDQAPPAVRSDSRLDPRAMPAGDRGAGVVGTDRQPAAPTTPAPATAPTSGSTATHFSPAARTIADLLAHYPAPPSAVRPAAPLLPVGEARAPEVATRLQGSVENSGLFYESHLQRWFRGERGAEQLAREPQMRVFREALSASGHPSRPAAVTEASPGGPRAADTAPAAPARADGAAPKESPASARAGEGDGPRAAEAAPRSQPALSEAQRETVHGVLRHQLEVLATPVLRWEGDVWTGLFMALLIQIPDPTAREHRERDQDTPEEPAQSWRSELTLRMETLGEVRVRLALSGEHLDLELAAAEDTARRLRAGGERLRERLRGIVPGTVEVTIHEESGHE